MPKKHQCGSPGWYGTDRLLVYGDEFVKDYVCAGEHAVGVQEGVEEVDGEEAQVGQPLQQAFHAGVADLQHLAGVHHLTEADIHVITVQTGIGPKHVTQIFRSDLHIYKSIMTSSVRRSAYLIIWGTVTLEFSSKAFIISPLQRILSMHCSKE